MGELKNYGVSCGLTNYASAYCVGLLVARRLLTLKKMEKMYTGNDKIDGSLYSVQDHIGERRPFKAYLDVGLVRTTTGNRVFGAMKVLAMAVSSSHTTRRDSQVSELRRWKKKQTKEERKRMMPHQRRRKSSLLRSMLSTSLESTSKSTMTLSRRMIQKHSRDSSLNGRRSLRAEHLRPCTRMFKLRSRRTQPRRRLHQRRRSQFAKSPRKPPFSSNRVVKESGLGLRKLDLQLERREFKRNSSRCSPTTEPELKI